MTDSEYPKAIYLARISEKTGNYENAIKYKKKNNKYEKFRYY